MPPQTTKDKILSNEKLMSHILSEYGITEADVKAMDVFAIGELISKIDEEINPEGGDS